MLTRYLRAAALLAVLALVVGMAFLPAPRALAFGGQGPNIQITAPATVALGDNFTVLATAVAPGGPIDPYAGYNIGLIYDTTGITFVSAADQSVQSGVFTAVIANCGTNFISRGDAQGTVMPPLEEFTTACVETTGMGSTRVGALASVTFRAAAVGRYLIHMRGVRPPDTADEVFAGSYGTFTIDEATDEIQNGLLSCSGTNCGAQPPDNESWDVTVNVVPRSVDLAASNTSAATVAAGATTAFALSVTNPATSASASNVVLTDTLPAAFDGPSTTFSGAGASACSVAGQTAVCDVGTMPSGTTFSATVNAVAGATTTRVQATNCATVTLNEMDAMPSNNTACADVDVLARGPDLVITGPASAMLGDDVTFTLSTQGAVPNPYSGYQVALSYDSVGATVTGMTDLSRSSGVWSTDFCTAPSIASGSAVAGCVSLAGATSAVGPLMQVHVHLTNVGTLVFHVVGIGDAGAADAAFTTNAADDSPQFGSVSCLGSCINQADATILVTTPDTSVDTDGDGYSDATETAMGTDPNVYCPIMRADLDNNGTISLIDLAILASTYRESIPPAPARYDQGRLPRDGKITLLDLAQLAGVYQKDVSDCP